MGIDFKVKPIINKINKQVVVSLPKKQLKNILDKENCKKHMRLRFMGWEN